MDATPRELQILDKGKYSVIETIQVPAFELVLCSPDTVNEIGRDAGLPVQAGALTDGKAHRVYLRWPPVERYIEQDGGKVPNPDFEYGMDRRSIEASLGYEILSNVTHRDTDPRGR